MPDRLPLLAATGETGDPHELTAEEEASCALRAIPPPGSPPAEDQELLAGDVGAAFDGDPLRGTPTRSSCASVASCDDVYRLAHELHRLEVPLPRMMASRPTERRESTFTEAR